MEILINSFNIEPKPPRSASQDERSGGGGALWNEERAIIPPIQHISNIPGLNLSLTSAGDFLGGVGGNVNENECVLHVICSPLVSAVNFFYARSSSRALNINATITGTRFALLTFCFFSFSSLALHLHTSCVVSFR